MTRHPLDIPSLVFGLLFAAIGTAALYDVLDFALLSADWLWPVALIASGIAVLLTLGSRQPTRDALPADDAAGEPGENRDVVTDR